MKNIILLLSILASFVLTDIIKAEPVKLTVDGGLEVELEIVGVVGTSLQIKGNENKLPLAALDKESLIRVIRELGRRLKSPASPTIELRKRQRRKPKTK
jgi:hypothetical protein